MVLQDIAKINTSIVVLPSGDFELKLEPRDIGGILREPQIEIIPSPVNIAKLTSMKDQVEILLSQGRIHIRDHSDIQPGTDRFTRIVADFMEFLAQTSSLNYRAFGLNYDVSFRLSLDELPAEVIATRFIDRAAVRNKSGLEIIGGSIRFFYRKGEALCFLYLEPLGNKLDASEFYAHINVHFAIDSSWPSQQELETLFRHEYDEFIHSVEAILG